MKGIFSLKKHSIAEKLFLDILIKRLSNKKS